MSQRGSESASGSPRESGSSDRMHAVICRGPENYQIDEVDVPVPGPGEALVRVEAIGICARSAITAPASSGETLIGPHGPRRT